MGGNQEGSSSHSVYVASFTAFFWRIFSLYGDRCTSKFRVIIKVIWTIWSQVLATGLYAFERLQIVLSVLFLAAVLRNFFI
jgi:hypothetical protein